MGLMTMTKYEKAIYDIVTESHEHLTVQQVFERLRVRYPRPTDCKNRSRDRISFRICAAMICWVSVSVRPSKNTMAWSTDRSVTW